MTPNDMKHFVGIAHIIRDSKDPEVFVKFHKLCTDYLPEHNRRPHYESFMSFVLCFDVNPNIRPGKILKNEESYTPHNIITAYLASCTISSTKDAKGRTLGKGFKHIPAFYAWLCQHFPDPVKKEFHDYLQAKYPDEIPFESKGRAIWKHVYNKKEPIFSKVPEFRSVKPIKKLTSTKDVKKRIQDFQKNPNFLKDYIAEHSTVTPPGPPPLPGQNPIKRDLLDPYNPDGIKFEGREGEINRLNGFANDNSANFQIWTVIAPSGAGKTRLTFEWTQRDKIKNNWAVFYLGQTPKGELVFHDPDHVYKNPHLADTYFNGVVDNGANWQAWSPDRDTILIIDYIFGFEEIINALVNRCVRRNSGLNKKIRLLVLDHVFPETLKSLDEDGRWLPIEDSVHRNNIFYKDQPLHLTQTDDQTDIMEKIIRSIALRPKPDGSVRELTDETVQQAMSYLEDTEGTWHPLFAALVGDALQNGQPFDRLDRRMLIEDYLDKKERLPWKFPALNDKDANKAETSKRLWASVFISVATILGGAKWQDLVGADYNETTDCPDDFASIRNLCERVISKSIEDDIPAFIPDILGESFFLLFLEKLSNLRNLKSVFYCLLTSGDIQTQKQTALNFIKVIQRLTRNLLTDDLRYTQNHWENLLDFLVPEKFPSGSFMRWAVNCSLLEISEQTMCTESHEHMFIFEEFFENVKKDEILISPPDISPPDSIDNKAHTAALQYCYLADFNGIYSLADNANILLRWYLLDKTETKLFMYPFRYSSAFERGIEAIQFITNVTDDNIYSRTERDETALILACRYNDEERASSLLDKMNRIDQFDKNKMTALMYACSRELKELASAMIKKMDQVDQVNFYRRSALFISCMRNMETTALELISKMNDVSQKDADNWTVLMHAARNGMASVVKELLLKNSIIDDTNNAGATALFIATSEGHEDTVEILLKEKANPDIEVEFKGKLYNAYDVARIEGYHSITRLLTSHRTEKD